MLNSNKENKLLEFDEDVEFVSTLSAEQYNVNKINSIAKNYAHFRQASKAP